MLRIREPQEAILISHEKPDTPMFDNMVYIGFSGDALYI
jgi:hypothetical protein